MANQYRFRTASDASESHEPALSRKYGRASTAVVREARHQARVADAVHRLVEAQTVYAFLQAGWTVREIADATGISKSEVGRLRTLMVDDDGSLEDGWLDVDDELAAAVAPEVARLWSAK